MSRSINMGPAETRSFLAAIRLIQREEDRRLTAIIRAGPTVFNAAPTITR